MKPLLLAALLMFLGTQERASAAPLPSLSVRDVSVVETERQITVSVPVTLSSPSSSPVSLKWTTRDNSAVAGADYTAKSGVLQLAAGQTTALIHIAVAGDKIEEADEAFNVTLSEPKNARFSRSGANVFVRDNDYSGQVTLSDAKGLEGQSGARNLAFKIALSTPPKHALSLNFLTKDGSAKAGSDYTAVSGTLLIKVRQTASVVNVPIVGDTQIEKDEGFSVGLKGARIAFSKALAIGTILNDDKPAPTPSPVPTATPAPTPTPIAAAPGVIAYNSFCVALGSEQIYVVNSDGTNKTLLTQEGGYSPSYKPDGSQIAFVSGRNGVSADIYTMNADGTEQKKIAENSSSPSWSPDGTRIAFVSSRDSEKSHSDIYVMNVNGSDQTQLTFDSSAEYAPSWSRDSSRVIFIRSQPVRGQVCSVDVATQQVTAVTSPTDTTIESAAYSPDGQNLVIQSFGFSNPEHSSYGGMALFVTNPDGSNRVQISYGDGMEAVWSPDGTQIAANFYGYPRGISLMKSDGTGKRLVVSNGSNPCHHPSWAPGVVPILAQPIVPPSTSGKIVFTSNRDGSGEIYVMNADGTNQTRLTNSAISEDHAPSFSRDGSKIVYVSTLDGQSKIYTMNADGTEQTCVSKGNSGELFQDEAPNFSPNASQIAFASGSNTASEIYVMNADGTGRTPLTANSVFDGHPYFSTYGNRIFFASRRNGNMEIHRMEKDGTDVLRFTNNDASDTQPAQSLGEEFIVWASERDGNSQIYWIDNHGHTDVNTRLTVNNFNDSNPCFSPDKRAIAFTSTGTTSQICVMNADGTDPTILTPLGGSDPSWATGSVSPPPQNSPAPRKSSANPSAAGS